MRDHHASLDVFEVIAGYYIGSIIYALHSAGVLPKLTFSVAPAVIAKEYGFDEQLFANLLEFVYQSSDFFEKTDTQCYQLRSKYRSYYSLGFQVDKFIGAYGQTVTALEASLRLPELGRSLVHREIESRAYDRIGSPPNPFTLDIMRTLSVSSLLDLGCGPATLLTQLAAENPNFRGWGIDASLDMCNVAAHRIKAAGVSHQVKIIHGDARLIASTMEPEDISLVETIHCKGLLDELFRRDSNAAIDFLRALKDLLPGRTLVIQDYYGKLQWSSEVDWKYRHSLLHDILQALTAQGVPPPSAAAWRQVYQESGCCFLHAVEAESKGIDWYLHLVAL